MNKRLILVLKYILKAVNEINTSAKQAYIDEATSILLEIETNYNNTQTLIDISTNTETTSLVNQINDNLNKNKPKEALHLFTKLKNYNLNNQVLLDDLETKISTKMKFVVN